MNSTRGSLLILLLAAACGGEAGERPPVEDALPAPLWADEEPLVLEDPDNDPLPVMLEPVDLSGVEGRAMTIKMGDSVQMSLMVQGLPGEGTYAAHVHRGTCESGGGQVARLNPVQAGEEGMGRSLTTMAGNVLAREEHYFVQVQDGGRAIACGDLHVEGQIR